MDLVKYFSGSRIFGTEHWLSDLDTVVIFKHRIVDVLRGICIDDWDHYPKDGGDMYEVQKFMNEIHQGNNYLTSVLVANSKEMTTPIWEKVLPRVKELALHTSKANPDNMFSWRHKNLEWLEGFLTGKFIGYEPRDVDPNQWRAMEALKRSVWLYYWTRQAIIYVENDEFIVHVDKLMGDTKYGEFVLTQKKNFGEEMPPIPWKAIYDELKTLNSWNGALPWNYDEMNAEWNWLRCDIIQDVRFDNIKIYCGDPEESRPGERTGRQASFDNGSKEKAD